MQHIILLFCQGKYFQFCNARDEIIFIDTLIYIVNRNITNFEDGTDLSLEINKGLIDLSDENGAGKTIFMRLMATLQSIKQGEIMINDIETKNKNYHRIRKIVGFMP
ncbi:ATP-binding cassette domain-containing protein [Paramaledivibacter caminithermalis]|uniref:ATP-binding cassette domain-containing protein n=1 Tax=Paramaledivibacter caminithermalis TaxID=191027 RepID=UPI0013F4F3D3|nr:ATP-binding cassette domain-containing protein [Paramaledivibacter caminithermalis]